MDNLLNPLQQVTLVDQVEEKLLSYFRSKRLGPGDSIPTLQELTDTLGVGTSVVREAISRLRMLGLIESRPHRGMVLREPPIFSGLKRVIEPYILGEDAMLNLLGFRVALEIGMADSIFKNINEEHIKELEDILERGNDDEFSQYSAEHDYEFHKKLYEITGNSIIIEFQEIIFPIFAFLREKYKDYILKINKESKKAGNLITHRDLVNSLKNGDREAFFQGMVDQFRAYSELLSENKNTTKKKR
ncbi:MAG: FadR family transcriptional regulator [Bacteroidales bacterium]|nr:FadR family transcriptional regulator [Bacteroidales bacterium]